METKTYSGWIRLDEHWDTFEALYVSEGEFPGEGGIPLAKQIQDDMEEFGNYLSVRYFITDEPKSLEECEEALIRKVCGASDVEFLERYSEATGYLWTDEKIKVGGHDLLAELDSSCHGYVVLEIGYSEKPKE